jgi:hypothetical protein
MTTWRPQVTEPLGRVTTFFGGLLIALMAVSAVAAIAGFGSFGGFGAASICAAPPGSGGTSTGGTGGYPGLAAHPGVSVSIIGTPRVCALHPSISQRILYTLTDLPGLLVWGAVLLLIGLVIRQTRQTGPFTVPVAQAMRRLGWVIIAGSAAAAALQGFAADQLLNTMLVAHDDFGDVLTQPIHALVPVPVLAGAALLTFARIIRLGAGMDDDLKGTV